MLRQASVLPLPARQSGDRPAEADGSTDTAPTGGWILFSCALGWKVVGEGRRVRRGKVGSWGKVGGIDVRKRDCRKVKFK